MTQSNIDAPEEGQNAKVSWRDWILLPILSLLTIFSLMAPVVLASRRMFPKPGTVSLSNCLVLDDQSTGARGRPNTTCSYWRAEEPVIEYKFNSCGYRAGMDCGPKPTGTYRIVMMGSSYAMGLGVPREDSFAALLPAELSRRTGRKIEIYDEGMWAGSPYRTLLSFKDVLAAKPDLILWPVTPWDIRNASDPGTINPKLNDEVGEETSSGRKATFSIDQAWNQMKDDFDHSRASLLLRHFLYASESQYLKAYLIEGDGASGFLKSNPSVDWQRRLQQFDSYAAEMERQAGAAGVPFVAVFAPNRGLAAMISMGGWPADDDPYKMDQEIRRIITSHGGIYIDILPDFRDIPVPEQNYYFVDNHPNANGHKMFAEILARELTNGVVPALRAAALPHSESEQKN